MCYIEDVFHVPRLHNQRWAQMISLVSCSFTNVMTWSTQTRSRPKQTYRYTFSAALPWKCLLLRSWLILCHGLTAEAKWPQYSLQQICLWCNLSAITFDFDFLVSNLWLGCFIYYSYCKPLSINNEAQRRTANFIWFHTHYLPPKRSNSKHTMGDDPMRKLFWGEVDQTYGLPTTITFDYSTQVSGVDELKVSKTSREIRLVLLSVKQMQYTISEESLISCYFFCWLLPIFLSALH